MLTVTLSTKTFVSSLAIKTKALINFFDLSKSVQLYSLLNLTFLSQSKKGVFYVDGSVTVIIGEAEILFSQWYIPEES